MLFSATMPKQLMEFARAGLKDPEIVRLDVESTISDKLKVGCAFWCMHASVNGQLRSRCLKHPPSHLRVCLHTVGVLHGAHRREARDAAVGAGGAAT